jgi:hypothetical protein
VRWRFALAVFVVGLGSSGTARADAFAEFGVGLVMPLSNKAWTDAVDPSLKIAARLGGGGEVGGFGSVDWSPMAADSSLITFHRFRIQGGVYLHKHVAPKVSLAARFSAGIDILHEHAQLDIPIVGRVEGSDTDVGLALEPAFGAWFDLKSVEIGVELALPIGYHSKQGNAANPANDAKFDYTSLDLDLIGGVRFAI